jgi:hypothetical protein
VALPRSPHARLPAFLGTYASVLAALTAEREAGRLRLSPLVITSGGELLSPAVQRRAEVAFGCLVNQSYAASEAMPLGLPCRYGRLHLNSFARRDGDWCGGPYPQDLRLCVTPLLATARNLTLLAARRAAVGGNRGRAVRCRIPVVAGGDQCRLGPRPRGATGVGRRLRPYSWGRG